jgi:hypothetical protein
MATFGPAQVALLTPFDFVACMTMLDDASKRGVISPTWLSVADDVRTKWRSEALALFSRQLGREIMPCDIEALVQRPPVSAQFDTWVRAETDLFDMRDENPRAFFAEYSR